MQKKIIYSIIAVMAVGAIGIGFSMTLNQDFEVHNTENHKHYYQSDLGKSFPNYTLYPSSSATDLDMEKAKIDIKSTVKGTIIEIGNLKRWTDSTMNPNLVSIVGERIKIEVQIQVEHATNDIYENGDIVTVTLTGALLPDGVSVHMDDNEQFELGEQVIIHVAEDPNNIVGNNVHYVKLGQYGKYSIQNDKAYNEQYHDGISIIEAFNEAQ